MDDHGFERFVHANLGRLVLHVIKLGATLAEAEDAVAEALADAWRKWADIEHPGQWVRLAAGHAFVRSARRDRERMNRAARGGFVADGHDPDLAELCGGGAARVVGLIQRLPMRQRQVMALVYDGYGADEIAGMLALPESTVRSHLRHARHRLRFELFGRDGEQGGEPDA